MARMTTKAFAVVMFLVLSLGATANAASTEFVRLMNVGKAHLENRNSAGALEAFAAAVKLEPRSAPALRNLARAQLLANQNAEAIQLLTRARSFEKNSAATAYLLGLAHAHESQFELAIPFFEEAVRLDPFTPALRFQLATAYQMARQNDKAAVQFRETVRLDPLHASACFKLAAMAALAGDRAAHEKHQQEFMRLRKLFSDDSRTPAALERCLHTQPEPAPMPAPKPGAAIKVRFTDATADAFANPAPSASAAAVLEMDERGGYAVLVVDAQGDAAVLRTNAERKLTRTAVSIEPRLRGPFHQCLVGNFFDDVPKGEKYDATLHARNDVLLVGTNSVALLKRIGPEAFTNVTETAGLNGRAAHRAQWIDYDHDGDIDLLLASAPSLQLWQNNGDATFTNVTAAVGLAGAGAAADVAAVDLEANVALDFIAAGGAQPSLVLINQRAGQFAKMPEPPGPWPSAHRVLADDLDNDGHMDALLARDDELLIIFGQRARRQSLDLKRLRDLTPLLLDFDNDGWLDVCVAGNAAAGQGTLQLWRNTGAGNWSDVTSATGVPTSLPAIRDLLAADLDGDGDTDLLLVTANGLRLLRNDGGNVNSQIKLRLVGTKTNPAGLGTRVEVRAGEFRVTRSFNTAALEIGLGKLKRLDSVQTVWGNGIVDNLIDLAAKPALTIAEKNVAAGSCPYLYAWDGRQFRFVTDLLGNSPLGLSYRRGAVLPADPEEIVCIGGAKNFRPRRGQYELEVTEELREVLYLDAAKLIAVDHTPEVEVHSIDKLGPPPYPPSELWTLRSPRAARSVLGDDGIDRTEATRRIDGVFAPPGHALPPPLRGQCEPLALTMDFGPLDVSRPLVLALTGWIQYGDASANIAASQNASLPFIAPKLEAEMGNGVWQPLEVVVGMPAGKTKTIVCDLNGKLPPGMRRLRLTTTFELRWDRIALFERAPASEVQQHELLPRAAELRFRGFSEIKSRASGHPQTPAYDKVSSRPPWRTTPQGWCTRYGDVLELVAARDERLAIVNAGDTVSLRFDAGALPPVPLGHTRTFFFYSVGWDKDSDPNVVEGDTVEPLPVNGGIDRAAAFNTRWVRGDLFSR